VTADSVGHHEENPSVTAFYRLFRVLALLGAVGLLSACERYVEKTRCADHFLEGDLGRWQVDSQGLATDPKTGLRWFRCNAGERFQEGQCLGDAHLMTKPDALAYVADFAQSAGKAWRLPTLDEMASLKETACTNPAINTQVFPSAKVEQYWASDRSRHGAQLACAYYSFSGNSYCRESVLNQRPFWLVLDR
jgi:hypothetical protein